MNNISIIELARPVVADLDTLKAVVAMLEARLLTAHQELKIQQKLNEELKQELQAMNTAALESSDVEYEGETDESSASGEEGGGSWVRCEVDEQKTDKGASVLVGDKGKRVTSEADDAQQKSFEQCGTQSSATRRRHLSSFRQRRTQHQCPHDSPRRRYRNLYIKIMAKGGPVFQAKIQEKLLNHFSQLEIHTDQPRVVLNEREHSTKAH
ncbi:hypothetical protein EDD11_008359 [Mortierella claussenii]|nr:hypothetical protein EDD11_008359 [Mortierella claussenii]